MSATNPAFDRAVREQIAANRARTPTERFMALCDLLDVVHAMAPQDPAAQERRRRALAAREREREHWRAEFRKFIAAHRTDTPSGV